MPQDFFGHVCWKQNGEPARVIEIGYLRSSNALRFSAQTSPRGPRYAIPSQVSGSQTAIRDCSVVSSISSAGHVLPYALVRFQNSHHHCRDHR